VGLFHFRYSEPRETTVLSDNENLFELTRGHRLRYGGAIAVLAVGTALTFMVPLVMRTAIDDMTTGAGTGRDLALAAALAFGLTVLAGLFLYLKGRWAATASEGIARRLRDHLYDHLQRLPARYHDRADTGDLVQRCTSDVETVRLFLAEQVVELGRAALMLLTVLPIMLSLDVRMTLISLVVFPVVLVGAIIFFQRVKATFLAVDQAEGGLTTRLQENLTGVRVVRAFGRKAHEVERFAVSNASYRDRTDRLFYLLAFYWSVSDFLCVAQIGAVLLYGASRVGGSTLTIGTLYAFLSLVTMLVFPARHAGRIVADMGKAVVALGRIREILGVSSETAADETAPVVGDSLPRGVIDVRDLVFTYGEGEPALDGISFEIAAGETLAILGPPGAGKSTIVHLLLRLYDYEQGSIRLDGREITSIDRRQLRRWLGVALQEPFLYSKTVRDNLRVGSMIAADHEIEAVAHAACVHGDVAGFEDGYDTLVGERGVTLSGGQRQRLQLARALLKDPPLLLLDDALSAVDSQTEGAILDALERRRGRRTTIVIAHRLSTLARADRVLVLERGRVAQIGTHDTLVRVDGPYQRLWSIQSALEATFEPASEAAPERRAGERLGEAS